MSRAMGRSKSGFGLLIQDVNCAVAYLQYVNVPRERNAGLDRNPQSPTPFELSQILHRQIDGNLYRNGH
jgi:hypothetical protein